MNTEKSSGRKKNQSFWKQAVVLAIGLSLLTGSSVRSQTVASIAGTITDATGAALSGASVTVKNLETGSQRIVTADDAGHFDVEALAVGQYEVEAEASGFRPEVKTGITLVVGQHAEVNLTLRVGQVQEAVIVQEQGPVVSVTTQDISGLVGERQVKDLPLNGRSYDQLLTLNPGDRELHVAAGGWDRHVELGGGKHVFGFGPPAAGESLFAERSGVHQRVGDQQHAGRSERATAGRGCGAGICRGEGYLRRGIRKAPWGAGQHRDRFGDEPVARQRVRIRAEHALDARNFFDQGSIPDFQRNVFGGSLGGPMRKDKTFLFGNYEGFRQNLGLSDLTLVPDAASRAAAVPSVQPLLALWPVANGPELLTSTGAPSGIAEAFSNPLQRHSRGLRHRALRPDDFGERFVLGVYTVDDSEAHSPTSNPISRVDIFLREQVASLSETHIFSPSLLNRATFGFSRGGVLFQQRERRWICLAGFMRTSRSARWWSAAAPR